METLYRKVTVSERKPTKSGTYFSNEGEVFYSSISKEFQHNYDPHTMYPDWWLEPIEPHQVEKLEADKKELLEALEDCKERLEGMNKKLLKFTNYSHISVYFASKLNYLIQKHKATPKI